MATHKRDVPLFKVHMPQSVIDPLREILFSGFIAEGKPVIEFENNLRAFIGNPLTISVNSCANAITLALRIAGVGPGADVITSPMTCVATNAPIATLFARPVWCDIDPSTGNIDPGQIEARITQKTKAILFVDWIGIPADLGRIREIGRRHGVKVVEDAAQAFGAMYHGEMVGCTSDFTCFSFQAIKHITTGDGGALSFRAHEDYERGRKLKWYGIDREATKDSAGNWRGSRWDCSIPEAGYKFHMNNIDATIGIEQLKCARDILKAHRENADYYLSNLKGIPGISLPIIPEGVVPSWWVFMIFADDRDNLASKLLEHGIHSSLLHVRNDIYECFKGSKTELPEVTKFQNSELCIPCGWWVTTEDREFIVETIKSGW